MKLKLKMPELTKWDKIAVAALVIFVILMAIPVYSPKEGCEIARPGFKCASVEEVVTEQCTYWSELACGGLEQDISITNVAWYICNLYNIRHPHAKLECDFQKLTERQGPAGAESTLAVLRSYCNEVSGKALC